MKTEIKINGEKLVNIIKVLDDGTRIYMMTVSVLSSQFVLNMMTNNDPDLLLLVTDIDTNDEIILSVTT